MAETEFYEANDAMAESRAMWLILGRSARDAAISVSDWNGDPKNVAMAMEWAAQAEACFWRATGDEETASITHWVPALRDPLARTVNQGEGDHVG